MTILTKWHKLMESVRQTQFLIGDTRLNPERLSQPWHDHIKNAIDYPKLVISPEVIKHLDPQVVSDSIVAMMDCNVLRLPYNPVMLEATFEDIPDEHFFVIVKDDVAILVGYRNDCAQVYPVINRIKFDYDQKSLSNYVTSAFVDLPMTEHVSKMQSQYVTKIVGRLISIAYLVTNIRGIVREEVVSERLNRKRQKSGKVPVPTYSLLRIGHVYTQTGEQVKYVQDGKTPMKIHMRRGHTRKQRCGERLSETKLIYIEPVLVNYHGGAAPEIKVKW